MIRTRTLDAAHGRWRDSSAARNLRGRFRRQAAAAVALCRPASSLVVERAAL